MTNPDTTTQSTPTPITGKITKLHEKGWGFITSHEKKFTRIFFHWTALEQDTLNFTELKVGMRVSFVPLTLDGRGMRAVKLRVLLDGNIPEVNDHVQREV